MKIVYFVHNLGDPAVGKRVAMLLAGGAQVVLIGFHRDETYLQPPQGVSAISLGRTHDARFGQRIAKVAGAALQSHRLKRAMAGATTIVARNLEMLCVAAAARRHAPQAALVYEALDVHRLLLSERPHGAALRWLERRLMANASLLIVSSPAFVTQYFEPRQGLGTRLRTPWKLVENKVFPAPPAAPASVRRPRPCRPWRIGWFGAIRCRRSLDILSELAARRPDLVEIVIRGRPSYTEFDDFDRQTARTPALRFEGPYRPDELPALYGSVHFTWAFDYFEAGANSDWLLPNRIYEGGLHGSTPLALARVETGAWLAAHGLGVLLGGPEEVEAVLEAMTPERYEALAARAAAAPWSLFLADAEECRALVSALAAPARDVRRRRQPFLEPSVT